MTGAIMNNQHDIQDLLEANKSLLNALDDVLYNSGIVSAWAVLPVQLERSLKRARVAMEAYRRYQPYAPGVTASHVTKT